MWNYRRAELIKFGWAQINQVALVISGPFLVISDAPLGEFKMGFLLNTPHTLAVPSSCSNRLEYRPFAFKIMMVACGLYRFRLRVPCVLGLKSTLEKPQIQVYSAGNGLLAGENGWPFRRFCGGGGGGLPAPLLAPRALILRTNQRLDALSRPTPPYCGHA